MKIMYNNYSVTTPTKATQQKFSTNLMTKNCTGLRGPDRVNSDRRHGVETATSLK